MDASTEAAAFWGSAQNEFYTKDERLACALKALEFFGGYYEDKENRDWLLDQVAGHVFDYTEYDTGVTKCRHTDHYGYTAMCWKAYVRQALDKRKEEI